MSAIDELHETTAALRDAGCVAAEEEAAELVEHAGGDSARLSELIARRCSGEPLAWLTGSVQFCGETVVVHPGVYVPRWQSEPMALEAAARLPERGLAVDLCTGSGAIAVVLSSRRPLARVLACDIAPLAVDCARANGLEAFCGDMDVALSEVPAGSVDVVTAVVPYVPTEALRLLPRDVLTFEPLQALDGGEGGTALLERAAKHAARLLRPGGSLLLELGGDQGELLRPTLVGEGFVGLELLVDDDGDVRALSARLSGVGTVAASR
ncbi:MAG: methyltransferase [Acidimicrobiaceae bacterium]|nr:methyltransferase [Acidimicrobiaceae bacterium]